MTRTLAGTVGTLTVIALAACADGQDLLPAEPEALSGPAAVSATGLPESVARDPAVNRDLAALRRATSRFHRPDAAAEAGYTVLVTHPASGAACLDHPTDGGMGRHMLNPALVDASVVVTEPEVIIYEPMKNGQLRMVGVEYIIPFAIRGPDETPPMLFGQEFLHNPTFELWMLHVYAWKDNPDGIFATWNPQISCEHDPAGG